MCPSLYSVAAKRMDLKQRFLKVYATLPLGVRKEIVLALPDPIGPISWEATYIEVERDTPVSREILDGLQKLQVI